MSNNVEIIKANPLVTRRNDNSGSLSRRVAACGVCSSARKSLETFERKG